MEALIGLIMAGRCQSSCLTIMTKSYPESSELHWRMYHVSLCLPGQQVHSDKLWLLHTANLSELITTRLAYQNDPSICTEVPSDAPESQIRLKPKCLAPWSQLIAVRLACQKSSTVHLSITDLFIHQRVSKRSCGEMRKRLLVWKLRYSRS